MLRRRIWKPRVAKTVRVRVRVRVNDDWGRQRIRVRECESASMNGARLRESKREWRDSVKARDAHIIVVGVESKVKIKRV